MKSNQCRPNVVFVLTDDQGYPALGAHGHPFLKTPNLDRFHADAVRFEQFHSGTTCAPTRAGLLTGHHCNSTGVWHTIGGRSLLRKDEWSLPAALRENGYRTGIFGKWHLGDSYPYRPQDRGFETAVCHGGGGISQQPDWWGNDYFDDTYMENGIPQEFQGYCTDVFHDEALKFIETHRDEPFFCYISTNAPHGPFNVDPKYRTMYTEKTGNSAYAGFLGMITNIDDNFGRLRAKLKELDLEENTILIFMSDNGQTGTEAGVEMYNAGMRGLKGSPYDGGHRVPFLLRWPQNGMDSGQPIEELTSYVDFMPTILDLCGIATPTDRTFHGDSLVPLLKGRKTDLWEKRIMVTDTQRVAHPIKWRMSCVMQDRWRLVNRTELYDMQTDPGQQQNIADLHPEIVVSLREGYEEWWRICSAQMYDEIPISIGADAEQETPLRSHDLRNEGDHAVVWNQSQVRQGQACNGWWEIFVEKDGLYEFELRRWPKEANHKIAGGIEGPDVTYRADGIQAGAEELYSGGNALDIDTAILDISGYPQQCKEVSSTDAGALFKQKLPQGQRHLRARFSNNAGHFYSSAYYVYVRRATGG